MYFPCQHTRTQSHCSKEEFSMSNKSQECPIYYHLLHVCRVTIAACPQHHSMILEVVKHLCSTNPPAGPDVLLMFSKQIPTCNAQCSWNHEWTPETQTSQRSQRSQRSQGVKFKGLILCLCVSFRIFRVFQNCPWNSETSWSYATNMLSWFNKLPPPSLALLHPLAQKNSTGCCVPRDFRIFPLAIQQASNLEK